VLSTLVNQSRMASLVASGEGGRAVCHVHPWAPRQGGMRKTLRGPGGHVLGAHE